MRKMISILCFLSIYSSFSQPSKIADKADKLSEEVLSKVIEWRHDIHQNPELSNREFKTAEKVAVHLENLGIEVQREVAKTGVVGILIGGTRRAAARSPPAKASPYRAPSSALRVARVRASCWTWSSVSASSGWSSSARR